jgi:hypothetical protein
MREIRYQCLHLARLGIRGASSLYVYIHGRAEGVLKLFLDKQGELGPRA